MEHALAMIEMKAISGAYDRQHEKDEAKRKKKIRRKEIEKSRGESVLPTKRHRKPTNFFHSMFDSQSKKGNDSAIKKKKKKPPKKRPEPDNSQDVRKRVEKYTDPIPRKKRRIIEDSDSGNDDFISDQDDVKRSDVGSVLAKCIPFATDSSLLCKEDIEEVIKSGRSNLGLLR